MKLGRTGRIVGAGLLLLSCSSPVAPEGRWIIGTWLWVRTVNSFGVVIEPEVEQLLDLSKNGVAQTFIDGRLESTEGYKVWVDDGSIWSEGSLLIRFEKRNQGGPRVVDHTPGDSLVMRTPATDPCGSTWTRASR